MSETREGANPVDLSPEHYINRELSWLEFNQRVLEESISPDNPPFEKLKFLSIVASNLDEFFMIRVASIWDQIDAGFDRPDAAGMTPHQQIAAITARVRVMVRRMYEVLHREIHPALRAAGIRLADEKILTREQEAFLDEYFKTDIYPVLTPMAVDATRPFPLILNRSLNLGVLIDEGEGEEPSFGTVQVPGGLSRVIPLPEKEGISLILLEQVIARYIGKLFAGRRILCCNAYRITRNADLSIDEEDAEDLLQEIENKLRQRGAARDRPPGGRAARQDSRSRAGAGGRRRLPDPRPHQPGFSGAEHLLSARLRAPEVQALLPPAAGSGRGREHVRPHKAGRPDALPPLRQL